MPAACMYVRVYNRHVMWCVVCTAVLLVREVQRAAAVDVQFDGSVQQRVYFAVTTSCSVIRVFTKKRVSPTHR